MAINNLEQELRRFELSDSDDKINYEKHSYNNFEGIQGSEAYGKYLDELYNTYFGDLREKIGNMVFTNNNLLLKFMASKINLFIEIRDEFLLKSTPDYWDGYIVRCETVDKEILQRSQFARNEFGIVKFFREMIGTQSYYIDKAIEELKVLQRTYSEDKAGVEAALIQPQQSKRNLQQDKYSYVDEYFSEYTEKDTLSNKDLEFIFNVDRGTIYNWREKKKRIVQVSEKREKIILYSKEDIINRIKDGILPNRLTSINKS